MPNWVMNGLKNIDGKLWQKWICTKCKDKKCEVTTGLNYEPGGGVCQREEL